jgi:membrane protease YdiL (CAAX protease family)
VLIFWIFLIGLFFGAVRERTGSTSLVILLHAIMNLLAVVETAVVVAQMP